MTNVKECNKTLKFYLIINEP